MQIQLLDGTVDLVARPTYPPTPATSRTYNCVEADTSGNRHNR